MEKDIGKLEEKEKLTPSDGKKIERLKELAKEHDREFEERHVEVLNFIDAEDTATLESEQAVFDERVDRVTEIIERLDQLVEDKESDMCLLESHEERLKVSMLTSRE